MSVLSLKQKGGFSYFDKTDLIRKDNSRERQIGIDMKERERILSILSKTPIMNHEHPNFYHGRLKHFPTVKSVHLTLSTMYDKKSYLSFFPEGSDPRVTLSSRHAPRHSVTPWLTSSEFQDKSRVLQDKIHYLTRLILASKRTVVCTGSPFYYHIFITSLLIISRRVLDLSAAHQPVSKRGLEADFWPFSVSGAHVDTSGCHFSYPKR